MTTRFDKLIEDFNVLPKSQNAIQSGPDIGMTTGDMAGTFPNRTGAIIGNLLPSNVQVKLKKKHVNKIYNLLSSALED
jgi:hypothetical protein